MNDLNRATLDAEIERQHEELAKLDPTSQEYKGLVDSCRILMECANQDDKIHNEAAIGKLKLDASTQAIESRDKIQEMKIESSKQAIKSKERWQLITCIANVGVAVITSITTFVCYKKLIKANEMIQIRSIDMEKEGLEHTSRNDKFVIKPNYPRL